MRTQWIFAAVLTAVLFAAVATVQIQSAKAATTRNFTLYGSYYSGWGSTSGSESSPGPTIVVEQGDTVNLTLTSTDGNTHRFFVSYTNQTSNNTGDPVSPDITGSGVPFQFVASNTVGTYQYRCAIHPTIMWGYFQIVPSNTIPEFQPLTILSLLAAATIATALVNRKKHQA